MPYYSTKPIRMLRKMNRRREVPGWRTSQRRLGRDSPLELGGRAFVQDRDLALGENAVAEIDLGLVLADLAQRLLEGELTALDLDSALGLDGREEVGHADGAVELLAVRRAGGNGEGEALELLGDRESGLLLLGGAGGALGLKLLETALRGLGRDGGEPLGGEIVAEVARGDLDDLAGLAELLHVVHKHHFDMHGVSPSA